MDAKLGQKKIMKRGGIQKYPLRVQDKRVSPGDDRKGQRPKGQQPDGPEERL